MPQLEENNQVFASHDLKSGLSWRMFLFLLFLFSAVGLLYVGLEFGYKSFLNNSISDLDQKIEESTARVGFEEQGNLIAFYSQIVNLNSILRDHPFTSNLFSFIEESTNTRVAYSNFSFNFSDRSITLDGVTESYELLASQVAFFEQSELVDRVELGLNSIQENTVKFSIKVIVKKELFDLTAS